jgi:hypothetical protein
MEISSWVFGSFVVSFLNSFSSLHWAAPNCPLGLSLLFVQLVTFFFFYFFVALFCFSFDSQVESKTLPARFVSAASLPATILETVMPSVFLKGNYLFRFNGRRFCRYFCLEEELNRFVRSKFGGCFLVQSCSCEGTLIPEVIIEVSFRLCGGSAPTPGEQELEDTIASRYLIKVVQERSASVPNSQVKPDDVKPPPAPPLKAKLPILSSRPHVIPFPIPPPTVNPPAPSSQMARNFEYISPGLEADKKDRIRIKKGQLREATEEEIAAACDRMAKLALEVRNEEWMKTREQNAIARRAAKEKSR